MPDELSPLTDHVSPNGSNSMFSENYSNIDIDRAVGADSSTIPSYPFSSPLQQPITSRNALLFTHPNGLPVNTPTRPARDAENINRRARALSRSSSVPSMESQVTQSKQHDTKLTPPAANTGGLVGSTRHSNSSVKHLTCFWWKEKGSCRFKDDQCLYAHHDTGHYTDPPRQLIPGEPALAGRKLDRAMRHLAITAHRSSGSLSSMAGSQQTSRPSTPVVNTESSYSVMNLNSSMMSPLNIAIPPQHSSNIDFVRLNGDNQFLRNLVDQNSKEKAIFIGTIESLQAENKGMRGELEGLRKAQEQLLAEREGLHNRISQLENGHPQNLGPVRSVSSPFGTIGRGRVNTETRYLGGLLNEEE